MKGLELSRNYYFDIAEPRLKEAFPDLFHRLAVGLAGNGSECFGYDDALSQDHDWGADFFIWVPESDGALVAQLAEWKRHLFEDHPPEHVRTRSEYGAHVGVMTVGDFYKSLIGYPEGPDDIPGWRRIPEENLAMATNGAIFVDNHGAFTKIRAKLLQFYPEDLRRKKLAARCMAIAQTGQYNYRRCFLREDWVTLQTVLARFADNVIAAVFLLNKVYRPFYKWAYRKLTELPVLGDTIASLLKELSLSSGTGQIVFETNTRIIDAICRLLITELQRQQLAFSDDEFMTTQGEEIQRSIQDSFLRSLPASGWEGGCPAER